MTIEGLTAVGVLVAFAGGLVSFVSPCVLPLVPIYLGHLSGVSFQDGKIQSKATTFLHSVGFVIGFSVVFVILGATVGLLGGTAGASKSSSPGSRASCSSPSASTWRDSSSCPS